MRALALACVALALGCTRHEKVAHPRELIGKDVQIEDGLAPIAGRVSSDPRGRLVVETERGAIPLESASRPTEIGRALGAAQGLGVGILIGAAGGALLGYAGGDDECDETVHGTCLLTFTAGEKAVLAGILVGGIGGIIGLLVGAARGHRTVYEFDTTVRF